MTTDTDKPFPYIGSHLLVDATDRIMESGSIREMARIRTSFEDDYGELRVVENCQAWRKPQGWWTHGHPGPGSEGAHYHG